MLSHGLNIAQLPDGRRAAIMRTSDRIQFRSCRRRWAWQSHMKANLTPYDQPAPLWFGSAFHYALEDFHGYKRFKTAAAAFTAFCYATAQNTKREIPPEANELLELGRNMLQYYENDWLSIRHADQTYWEDGIPQVEVNFEIPIPINAIDDPLLWSYMQEQEIDVVLYRGTFDGICIDENGNLWVREYKTAKRAEANHFLVDPQITAYLWAAAQLYDRPVVGVIYHQFVKKIAKVPQPGSNGQLSTAMNLTTSQVLYKKALIKYYGSVERAPKKNLNFLWDLAQQENPDKDTYIQREKVYRNIASAQSELVKIKLELEDILNPDLPLYPTPTRDCHYRCPFMSACVSMDDGSDFEAELEMNFKPRRDLEEYWRSRLPSSGLVEYMEQTGFPDLEAINLGQAMPSAQQTEGIDFSIIEGTVVPIESQLPEPELKGRFSEEDTIDKFTVDMSEID